jgi:cytochrome c biogenesis protein CcmG, thiol:disulfide interchange protein DsbE
VRLSRRCVLRRGALALAALPSLLSNVALANELHVGAMAPPATLVTLDGRALASRDLQGRVVVLTFWATWCSACRDELPLLSEYARQAGADLQVLGFNLDGADQLAHVRQAAEALSFPVGLLEKSNAAGYGRIWRLPVSFVIDRRGYLADDGWHDKQSVWTAERLERVVTPLLTQKPAGTE